jgi:hypothetical protein
MTRLVFPLLQNTLNDRGLPSANGLNRLSGSGTLRKATESRRYSTAHKKASQTVKKEKKRGLQRKI